MPGNDATRRQNENFRRQNPEPFGNQTFARLAEQREGTQGGTSTGGTTPSGKSTTILYPIRTGGRATLVERDNPEEFLEFHWDPTTYDIAKSAKWTENAVEGGTDTLSYSGCGPTQVTFELFLNEIGQPHPTQRSVESAITWLMNRLRPRTEEESARRGLRNPTLVQKYLNVLDAEARKPPPILILFGLRDGFECVLTDVKIKTEMQTPPIPLEGFGLTTAEAQLVRAGRNPSTFGGVNNPGQARAFAQIGQSFTRAIRRARVGITLKEYTKAAAAGAESGS